MRQWVKTFNTWRPSEKGLVVYLSLVCAIYLIWLGGLKLTEPELKQIQYWLGNSPLFAPLLSWLGSSVIAVLMLIFEVTAGLLLLTGLFRPALGAVGAAMASLVFLLNFLYLFTNPVWVSSLGGFPFLGSGQGVVKYLSMWVVAAYVLVFQLEQVTSGRSLETFKVGLTRLAFVGVAIVMGWIGWLKFYTFEAEGIVRLMESNFLFSWTYLIWGVQGASNFIGIVEWLFLLLLLSMPWNRTLGRLGILGIAATAFGTLTFLFSVPGWNEDAFFPLLNGSGVFFIKDQLLLACALIIGYRYQ
ncbi:MAG: DUF417 family protein [Endozoicomonas sp.]|uniref:DUF417 family protein n=1 Tax=Endozoicomonas sp. TaxID=1892382 RepID=UPI003D9AD569